MILVDRDKDQINAGMKRAKQWAKADPASEGAQDPEPSETWVRLNLLVPSCHNSITSSYALCGPLLLTVSNYHTPRLKQGIVSNRKVQSPRRAGNPQARRVPPAVPAPPNRRKQARRRRRRPIQKERPLPSEHVGTYKSILTYYPVLVAFV